MKTRAFGRHWIAGLLALCLWPTVAMAADDKPLSGGVMDILDKGGVVLVLIIVGSVVAVALAFERLVSLRRSQLVPKDLVQSLRDAAGDPSRLSAATEQRDGPLPRIIRAGLSRLDLGTEAVEHGMEMQGAHEVARLRRPVKPIAILATLQPLLGLLGTVIGMIGTFNALAGTAAAERVEKLAPGIGQALYTTAGGLLAAIPCVALYHWLMGRVNRAAEEWSLVGSDVIAALGRRGAP